MAVASVWLTSLSNTTITTSNQSGGATPQLEMIMETEVECEKGFAVVYNTHGAILFPDSKWIAYEEGACGDDPCAYGATPEEAIENLKERLDYD